MTDYKRKESCNDTATDNTHSIASIQQALTHGLHVGLPDTSHLTATHTACIITLVSVILCKLAALPWYPTPTVALMARTVRAGVRNSLLFLPLLAIVVTVLASGASFIYNTDRQFSIANSFSTVIALLVGDTDNFNSKSEDLMLDYVVFVGYTFLIICTFSEFFVQFILSAN